MKKCTGWAAWGAATALIGCSITPAWAASVDDLYFSTEIYPPFNLQDGKMLKGMSVDLLVAMFEQMHAKSTRKDIHLSPWARGYKKAVKKKNACIFSTTRTKQREDKFQWIGPIHSTDIALFANKKRNIKIHDIKDVAHYRVGVVIDDIGEQLLLAGGISAKQMDRLGGINVIEQSLKKLSKKRIDLFAYEENAAKWSIKKYGMNPDDFEVVYILKSGDLYYACNKNTPKEVMDAMQQSLDALKKDGTYQKIVDQYL